MPEVMERGTALTLEIRGAASSMLPMREELERAGLHPLGRNRLLQFTPAIDLTPAAESVLLDPLIERMAGGEHHPVFVDVFCLPGVTDAEGEAAAAALALVGMSGILCRAGTRYTFDAPVPPALRVTVERLVGNPVIHRFRWHDEPGTGTADASPSVPPVETIPLAGLDDAALAALSTAHGLALDVNEMRAVQREFGRLGRPPTDVELQSIALCWSEHCSHKTFKAPIDLVRNGQTKRIPGLLASCLVEPLRERPRRWVRSAFADNAGVIALDAQHDLAIKVETHNHPSALEPFGGAHTGVGGVIRDVLAVSAEPFANLDVLCFGPPDFPDDQLPAGVFPPRTTMREVVRGIADYGNNMGIPTVSGALAFHPGYTANPLVFCGTLGLAPHGGHPRDPGPGDLVVLLGGRTGRDGLHGATMSSAGLARAETAASTVQIGAPIVEKMVRDVLPLLRDEHLYTAINDCGAGGLCSAAGEMAAELGLEIDLALVPLKYEGLAPWEIWLSEAQERMVLAVPPDSWSRLLQICAEYGVEATAVGHLRADGRLLLRHGPAVVADLSLELLHDGRPVELLTARAPSLPTPSAPLCPADLDACLLRLLAHPTVASKEGVIRRYDHEVGAATASGPFAGRSGPADAAILRPVPDSPRGVVVAIGMQPLATALDPYEMALGSVDEALRNLVAVGGSIGRCVLLDNFCWGDVDDPAELGALALAAEGCRDAVRRYGAPFICGKDSLRNTSVDRSGRHSIPGTLVVTAVGVVPHADHCITMDLKQPGDVLYLLGVTDSGLGGSLLAHLLSVEGGALPRTRAETPALMRRLTRATRRGLVRACHDLSEGGLAVTAAEMAIAGGLGLALDLDRVPHEGADTRADVVALLYGETPGRFLVEVPPASCRRFEQLLGPLPYAGVGAVIAAPRLTVRREGRVVLDRSLVELEEGWRTEW